MDTKFSPTCNSSFKWTSLLLHSGGFWRTLTAILGLCKTFISMQMKNQNSLCNYISESTFSNLSVKPKEFFNLFQDTRLVPMWCKKFKYHLRNKRELFLKVRVWIHTRKFEYWFCEETIGFKYLKQKLGKKMFRSATFGTWNEPIKVCQLLELWEIIDFVPLPVINIWFLKFLLKLHLWSISKFKRRASFSKSLKFFCCNLFQVVSLFFLFPLWINWHS